ncbi:hypothetical protein BOTBODRAFT_481020 [Botryobasidium botryosum FD-172 SS1]|uniref:HIT-type domain-containing protein n=1 Tax=Botryobasidium botryosum (strain FD-172 SS1) TaxID=930990 RepID=A0A067N4D9_BOTB1|nr:hypothetical protein BOTBODRAFT_481020 [Botryobasidium botryosum FD-172 SS1]
MSTTESISKPSIILGLSVDIDADTNADKVLCGICHRQFMKYSCPTCNLSYCSLTCYRSDAHSQCTEVFYKRSLEEQIRSEPSKTTEEKRQMLSMLKRFEEESANADEEGLLGSGSGDEAEAEEDNLSKRLENVDLDSADTNVLWSALSEKQREQFMRAMRDPSSELAQELLASEDLALYAFTPWWEASSIDGSEHAPPAMMELPESMVGGTGSVRGPSLLYNLFAISLAYAYATRRLQLSPLSSIAPTGPDGDAAHGLVVKLVPFLADPKSAVVFESVEEVVTDIWSRADLSRLELRQSLGDAVRLLRPSLVTVESPTPFAPGSGMVESHPRVNAFRMLSDLHTLFGGARRGASQKRGVHIRRKLVFYGAHLVRSPDLAYARMVGAVGTKAREVEAEGTPEGRGLGGERVLPFQGPVSVIEEM